MRGELTYGFDKMDWANEKSINEAFAGAAVVGGAVRIAWVALRYGTDWLGEGCCWGGYGKNYDEGDDEILQLHDGILRG